ncbi:MAG TPA: His/Gly/Thr/Pro-type tRNA ligase C-terminal domain-containing protein, partial [Saprospiraceae bacterium]|nr:His/Gly/Thr/Pro-type tRNA ligase C-terminal domain-containing protein [Saprospiraceae bacterium]
QAKGVQMGSIGGGGRYDNLTGIFGLEGVSGVGVSFGADRIYDVMEELNLFPAEALDSLRLLFIAFDEATHRYAFQLLGQVRAAGINAELYPEPAKMKKQMKYANDRRVPFVAIIGSEEMAAGEVTLKNMETGEQVRVGAENLIEQMKK